MKRIVNILAMSGSLFSLMADTATLKENTNIRVEPSLDSPTVEVLKNVSQESIEFNALAVTKKNVNVRAKPSLKAKINALLGKGTEISTVRKITNPEGEWYETSSGFMFADLVAITHVNTPIKSSSEKVVVQTTATPEELTSEKPLQEIMVTKAPKETKKEATPGLKRTVLNHYKEKDYLKSYQALKEVQLDKLNNPELYFYLGRSAFELGKHEEALEAYNKALSTDPDNARSRLEKARTLFTLQNYENAKAEFEIVLNSPVPPSVKNNIKRYLDVIDKKGQKNFMSGVFIFGLGHDNNVLNHTFEDMSFNGITPTNNERKSAVYHQEILLLNHQYKFADITNLTWNTSFTAYNQGYINVSEANLFLVGLSTGPAYIKGSYKFSLPLSYYKINYGGESYLHTSSIAPRIDYLFNKTLSVNAALNFQQKKYKQSTRSTNNIRTAIPSRDAIYKELSLGANQLLFGTDLLSVKVIFAKERKDGGTALDVNKNRTSLQYSYSKKITEMFNAALSYGVIKDSYKDPTFNNNLRNTQRDDINKNIGLKLGAKVRNNISIDLNYNYIDNDSTINAYTYKKSIYLVNTTIAF